MEPAREDAQSVEEAQTRRRPGRAIVAVLLLLLVLLCACAAVSLNPLSGSVSVTFAVRNAECLACHPQQLVERRMPSVHDPFMTDTCTSCHNQHAKIVEMVVRSEASTSTVIAQSWLRWGPLRPFFSWVQSVFLGGGGSTETTAESEVLGKATLVADMDELCYTCHGGLAADRSMEFPHRPFAVNRCMDCHKPHASEDGPLLVAAPEDLCLSCHRMGPELARSDEHPPAKQRKCLECHEGHASDYDGLLVAAQRDLCFTCHPTVAVLSNRAMQHDPFEFDACTGCHEPHGSEYTPLLISESPELCYSCHTTIEPRLDRASHHPIGTELDCDSCHEPHASDFSGLLVQSERRLCTGCHTDIAGLSALSVQHAPFADDPCTACHTPHGSDFEPLLRNPQPNLCYRCHPELARAMSRVSHHPDDCAVCHEPHAGNFEKLLPAPVDNGLCYQCHGEVALTYLSSGHRAVPCLGCHNPHGSRFGALRRTSPTALCSQCHKANEPHSRFVGGNSHRVTPRWYDVNADMPLTCTSTCHDPHGTSYTYMMRYMEPQFDGLCLRCHVGVGKRY